jgi:hypothetical protein
VEPARQLDKGLMIQRLNHGAIDLRQLEWLLFRHDIRDSQQLPFGQSKSTAKPSKLPSESIRHTPIEGM